MEYKEYIKSKILEDVNKIESKMYSVGFTKKDSNKLSTLYNKLGKLK